MEAVLKIYGDIGIPDPMFEMFGLEDSNISAKTVSDFLDNNKEAKNLTVKINSRGGDVQEGWAIYDLLTNSGKKITTVGEGKVYSIATIIFLAGSERQMMKNADGLIHNPYIPPYTLADAYGSEELQKLAEGLQQEEEKILDFYAKKTGSDKEKLREYMKEDTKLSAEDMLSLGFATKILEPVKAYAYLKPINKFKMDEKDVKTFGEKLDAIIAKIAGFSRLSTKDQTLTDKDGKELKLDKETGAPAVGDKCTPDGSFVMADGKTITVANGVITAISEKAEDKTELELANEKIATLTAQLADVETAKADALKAKTEAEAAKSQTVAKEAEAVALITELKALKNSWKPEGRNHVNFTSGKVGEINIDKVKELTDKQTSKN
jgi:ATP-dependent protease ClpP protease subunit